MNNQTSLDSIPLKPADKQATTNLVVKVQTLRHHVADAASNAWILEKNLKDAQDRLEKATSILKQTSEELFLADKELTQRVQQTAQSYEIDATKYFFDITTMAFKPIKPTNETNETSPMKSEV